MPRPDPFALTGLLALAACAGPTLPETTGEVSVERFASDVVGDDYVLDIRTPPGAEEGGTWPLVLQLDPGFVGGQFDLTAGLISEAAADGRWSEALVVGVGYDDPMTRFRDYPVDDVPSADFDGQEGADAFYRVLRDELVPHLRETLPVDPTRVLLVGHSLGAAFGWYATFRTDPQAGPLVTHVIAADAGIPEALFTLERWYAERAEDLPVRVYATRALDNGPLQGIAFDALEERVTARGYASFQLDTDRLDTDHGGALRPSYTEGLDRFLGTETP